MEKEAGAGAEALIQNEKGAGAEEKMTRQKLKRPFKGLKDIYFTFSRTPSLFTERWRTDWVTLP
jgi:hypothetical protein